MPETQPTPSILAVRDEDPLRAPVDYILRTFARLAGFPLEIIGPGELAARVAGQRAPADGGGAPCLLLFYATRQRLAELYRHVRKGECRVLAVERGPFFGDSYLVSPDLPAPPADLMAAADATGFPGHLQRPAGRMAVLTLDVFAAAFWFLTRYEEYVTSSPDPHGRFLCAHSVAPPEMYARPLVNLWFERLRAVALDVAGLGTADELRQPARTTVALTHDVDVLAKYRGVRGVRRVISSIARPGETTAELRMGSLVMAGLRRDPYDSFDELFTLKERIGAPGTFFLMGGGRHPLDGDYELHDPRIRRIVTRARNGGDEIGAHPSYESYLDAEMIRKEAAAVAKAAKRPVQGSRQHYLRFSMPETLRAVEKAGLRYESTMGFPDRAGFRCGWSGCFTPFDLEEGRELALVEVPLVAMDVSLAVYEKLESNHALERVSGLMDASNVPGGAFVFLWHNIMRDRSAYPGFWDTFEFVFFAAAGSARYATLGSLVDEYAGPAPATA